MSRRTILVLVVYYCLTHKLCFLNNKYVFNVAHQYMMTQSKYLFRYILFLRKAYKLFSFGSSDEEVF